MYERSIQKIKIYNFIGMIFDLIKVNFMYGVLIHTNNKCWQILENRVKIDRDNCCAIRSMFIYILSSTHYATRDHSGTLPEITLVVISGSVVG